MILFVLSRINPSLKSSYPIYPGYFSHSWIERLQTKFIGDLTAGLNIAISAFLRRQPCTTIGLCLHRQFKDSTIWSVCYVVSLVGNSNSGRAIDPQKMQLSFGGLHGQIHFLLDHPSHTWVSKAINTCICKCFAQQYSASFLQSLQ